MLLQIGHAAALDLCNWLRSNNFVSKESVPSAAIWSYYEIKDSTRYYEAFPTRASTPSPCTPCLQDWNVWCTNAGGLSWDRTQPSRDHPEHCAVSEVWGRCRSPCRWRGGSRGRSSRSHCRHTATPRSPLTYPLSPEQKGFSESEISNGFHWFNRIYETWRPMQR